MIPDFPINKNKIGPIEFFFWIQTYLGFIVLILTYICIYNTYKKLWMLGVVIICRAQKFELFPFTLLCLWIVGYFPNKEKSYITQSKVLDATR